MKPAYQRFCILCLTLVVSSSGAAVVDPPLVTRSTGSGSVAGPVRPGEQGPAPAGEVPPGRRGSEREAIAHVVRPDTKRIGDVDALDRQAKGPESREMQRRLEALKQERAKEGILGPRELPQTGDEIRLRQPETPIPAGPTPLTQRFVRPKPEFTPQREGVFREAVVVKLVQPSRVRLREGALASLDGSHDTTPLNAHLAGFPGLKIERLFTRPEQDLEADRALGEAKTGQELGDLNLYFLIDLRQVEGVDPEAFVDTLNRLDLVELAYQLERSEPAAVLTAGGGIRAIEASPAVVGNYEAQQGYLNAAPVGIDAEWAWGLTGGRGNNVRFIDIEGDWNLNHVDLPAPFVRIPGSYAVPGPGCDTTPPPPQNVCTFPTDHGTAVLGQVVSSNNGFGTTGIASSALYGVSSAANGTSWPNVANAINLAAANLTAGDIILYEMHALGPDSGFGCPCNCDQFEFIAMEYWQANFDATQAAVALGIHVVEAAGNGSMDLDSGIYGGVFNRSVRDSGAIVVGAGNSATHSPMCWTNHGSRVDLHGWGNGVVTLGYGSRYSEFSLTCPPAGNCSGSHNTLYASDFGGTSGASPIIVGAAAIVGGVSETKYGQILTPAFMRSVLSINPTPQGAPSADHIGPMPDLRQVIRADLARFQPGGWSDSLVARNTTGCSGGSCAVTTSLPGNSSGTYLSYSGRNNGIYETTGVEARLYVDDQWAWYNVWSPLNPGAWPAAVNAGPLIVRGGRHTLRASWDHHDTTPEWSEANNDDTVQYVWSPQVLTANLPLLRAAPPDRDTPGYLWFNCDGFRMTGLGGGNSWWIAAAVLPVNAGDDYDVRLHDEVPTSTSGFGANVATSIGGAGLSDFVLANGNQIGATVTRWAGVIQGTGTPAGGDVAVQFAVGDSIGAARGIHGPYTLGSGRILDVHEVYFAPGDVGTSFDFRLDNMGAADLGISFYSAADSHVAKSQHMAGGYADITGAGGDEAFALVIPDSGWYGLVVWKYAAADRLLAGDYTVEISETLPDLQPHTPSGWSSPLIMRSATGCTTAACVGTPTLTGNSAGSYFNSMGTNAGPNPSSGTHRTQYFVDDVPVTWWQSPNPVAPGGIFYNLDAPSLSVIRGGRHTAGMNIDVFDGVAESDEDDNAYYKQYVWSPYVLTSGVPVIRPAPPDRDSAGYYWYNCDGFSHVSGWWGAAGVLPVSQVDNYDVRLHDDYTGSTAGFGPHLAWSGEGPGRSDFVLVNGNIEGFGTTWYAGVIQGTDTPGTRDVAVHQVADAGTLVPSGTAGPFGIPSSGVLFVIEYGFLNSAGKNYRLRLHNDAGGADLGFGLYAATGSFFRKADALVAANLAGAGADEQFDATIPTDGYYGLVVWKSGSPDLARSSSFRIEVAEVLPTVVPDGDAGAPVRVTTVSPSSLTVTWGRDCNETAATDYSVYVGDLDRLRGGASYFYGAAGPVCNAGQDHVETLAMPAGNVFLIVVPHDGVVEGSYGPDSSGSERSAAGTFACHPRDLSGTCLAN